MANENAYNMFGNSFNESKSSEAGQEKGSEVEQAEPVAKTEATEEPKKATVATEDYTSAIAEQVKRTVPVEEIAKQREKKREAQAKSDQLESELNEIKQQLEELKKTSSPEAVEGYLQDLKDMEDDDVVTASKVRGVLASAMKVASDQSYKNGLKAADEYYKTVSAEQKASLNKQLLENAAAKSKNDEIEFLEKTGVDLRKVIPAAMKFGYISNEDISEISTQNGNIAENVYNRIIENKKQAESFDSIIKPLSNNKDTEPDQPDKPKKTGLMEWLDSRK